MKQLLCLFLSLACLSSAEELLKPGFADIAKPVACKVSYEKRDGRTVLVAEGNSSDADASKSNSRYLQFTLKFKRPVSLVGKSLLIQADYAARVEDSHFFVRGFNVGERKTPWSFHLNLARHFSILPDHTLVLTTGASGAARWERELLGGNPPDKVSSLQFFISTRQPNNPIRLTIHSLRLTKAMDTSKDRIIGFSSLKENWEKVDKPASLPAETILVKDGAAQFDLIHPDSPAGRQAARRIADAIADACPGAKPPRLIPGTLKERVPERTAIFLGNIYDNPAMLTLYARRAIIADRKWPGRGGHVVRTVFEPFRRGADAIALEASDDAGLAQVADAFCRLLGASARRQGSDLFLPRLFEQKLPEGYAPPKFRKTYVADGLAKARQILAEGKHTSLGGHLATIAKNYLTWQNPLDARLYVEVCRLYRKSAVADPSKYGGPWGFDSDFPSVYAIAGWDLIEHDPALTAEDRLEAERCLIGWLNQAIAAEASGGLQFNGVVGNHLTFCSMGTMMGGLYFSKAHPELATPADWLAIARYNFHRQIAAGKVSDDCDSYQWLTWHHCAVYSLAMPDDTFFTFQCPSGRTTASQGVYVCGHTMDSLWTQAPYGDDGGWASSGSDLPFLRMVFAATRDPLAETILALKTERWNRDVQHPGISGSKRTDLPGVGDYNGDYRSRPEPSLEGLQVIPLDPVYRKTHVSPMPVPPLERCFDKLAFRKALKPGAFYALVDGVNNGGHRHEDAASILRLTLHDREWLMENGYTKPQQKFHNTLLFLADGQAFSLPDYVELVDQGDTKDFAWATVRASGFGPADWTRRLYWLKAEDALVVVDDLKARRDAFAQVRQRWNGVGVCTVRNDGIHLVQKGPSFRIQCWDNTRLTRQSDPEFGQGWNNYPFAAKTAHILDQNFEGALKAGASVVMGALLHGSAEGDTPPWAFRREADGFTVDTGRRRYRVAVGPDGRPVCRADASRATLEEPPKPRPAPPAKFPGRDLKTLHAFRLQEETRAAREITCAIPFGAQGQSRYALATRGGEVHILDAEARPVASFSVGAAVNDLAAADLDGDGAPELLLACEDTCLRACRLDGAILWKHDFPFYRRRAICTLVRVADLERDGRLTILAGCDNWRVYALALDGRELWTHEVVHPTRALETADLDGDGKLEILCGTQYYFASVLDSRGNRILRGHFGRGVKAVAAARTGKKLSTFAVGEDKGVITFFRPVGNIIATFATGNEVMRAATVPRVGDAAREDLLACSLNGFAYRFDCDGKCLWARNLAAPVLRCRALPDGTAVFGTESGAVVLIAADGAILAHADLGAPVTDLRVLPENRIAAATDHGDFAILQ